MLEPVFGDWEVRLVISVERPYVRRSWLICWIDIDRSDDFFLRQRTRGGQGWRMRRVWCYTISERDQAPRSKNGYSTSRKSRRGGVWKSSIDFPANSRVSFLQSQINRYRPRKVWKGATPDVLDAPDNKVNPRPRCRTSVANESNPRAFCDLRCNIPCVRVCSRFRWCYTRGHMTQYHTTAAGCWMLRWETRGCTINSGRLLPGFYAVRHNKIPLRW